MKKFLLPSLVIVIAIVGVIIFTQSTELTSMEKITPLSLQEKVDEVDRQFQSGEITREKANDYFCNMNVRPENERQKAIKSIREYSKNPTLEVTYVCNNFSPNNPEREPTEETYQANGKYYFIDIATNQVLRVQ